MGCALWVQTAVLAVTAAIICWYTVETSRMRREVARQNSISLRPVVVLEFKQDVAQNLSLLAVNIGHGAAFNVTTVPLNVVPGDDSWDIHFDRIHFLASQDKREVQYAMPNLASSDKADRGYIFFPQVTLKRRELRIEYQDVEGGRYCQDLTVHPKKEDSSAYGYVTYAPIRTPGAKS
jgi:hypothetical protein